jgi:hypothetical protein
MPKRAPEIEMVRNRERRAGKGLRNTANESFWRERKLDLISIKKAFAQKSPTRGVRCAVKPVKRVLGLPQRMAPFSGS